MTPHGFLAKWRANELKERSASQSHFNDLCALLGVLDPVSADPTGEWFTFEKGASKTSGGDGWADVWRRECFAWEYKGRHANLDKAYNQLLQYAVALENPPLLIVSDMDRIVIRTNWTNTVQEKREFALEDLVDGAMRDRLKSAFLDPETFKPKKSRQELTEKTAGEFAGLAQRLRDRGHEAHQAAHFVNRLVFCTFAEDVGLLPNNLFTKMLEVSRRDSDEFTANARTPPAMRAVPLPVSGRIGSLLAAFALLWVSPLAAKDSLGVFGDWGAFRDPGVPRCYAIAAAEDDRRSSSARRGSAQNSRDHAPYASVGTWPERDVRGQVHVRLSRNVAEGSAISLSVGGRRFALTGGGGDAWARDRAMDAAIVAAMRSADSMRVSARDRAGRRFSDRYSLDGVATALDAATVGCARIR